MTNSVPVLPAAFSIGWAIAAPLSCLAPITEILRFSSTCFQLLRFVFIAFVASKYTIH